MADQNPNRGPRYTRSWKNLLINRRYQLRFTLFMVGISALLMIGLGMWVLKEADEATTIGKDSIAGIACPTVPELLIAEPGHVETSPGSPKLRSSTATAPKARSGAAKRRMVVQLDASSMTTAIPKTYPSAVIAQWLCETNNATTMQALDRGRMYILWELIGTGLLLVVGLAIYGIAMTHRVAGPLYKVSLYFTKMRDGRYSAVDNLRKRDQLIDFYDHFKDAHAGIVQMEKDDIAQIKALLAAAQAAGATDQECVNELKALLERKEKSLE